MKQVLLNKMTLEHFRGVKRFELTPGGGDLSVLGRNGSGKTTLAHALWWCLFGKSAEGDTKFNVKPEGIQGAEPTVVVELEAVQDDLHEPPIEFRRVMKEIWKKTKGQKERLFSGHTTDYSIDGVPVKQKEFQERVAEVCGSETTFKLLTSTTYFNALKWQERRELVLAVSGDVSHEQVIGAHPELVELDRLRGKLDVEQYRIKARRDRKETNERLDELPARIDELEKSVTAEPEAASGRTAAEIRGEIETQERKKLALEQGDQSVLLAKRNAIQTDLAGMRERQNAQREKLKSEWHEAVRKLNQQKIERETLDTQVERNRAEMEKLRAEFLAIAASEFRGGACPTCGEEIPEERLAEVMKVINHHTALRKKEINERGMALKRAVEAAERRRLAIEEEVEALNEEVTTRQNGLDDLCAKAEREQSPLKEQLRVVDEESAAKRPTDTREMEARITALRHELAARLERQAAAVQQEQTRQRIEELKGVQKALAGQVESLERGLELCDDYIRARVALLEGRVSEKFRPLSFRMFDEQINGGLAETCELVMEGKLYGDLSTGEKVIAGLKCVEVLAEHYGISCPVFVDNAESVTLDMQSDRYQQVYLYAEGGTERLRVVETTAAEVAA